MKTDKQLVEEILRGIDYHDKIKHIDQILSLLESACKEAKREELESLLTYPVASRPDQYIPRGMVARRLKELEEKREQ